MKSWIKTIVILVAVVVGVAGYLLLANRTQDNGQTPSEQTQAEVVIETPQRGDLVKSPLAVKGKAKGIWFFEANLPVTLKDQNGKILAQKGFQAKGEWMTEDYVEFEDTLTFAAPTTEFGVLVIENDNPSGLKEFEKSFAVPVRFK
ncbi:MAG: Gmad2 immunoglobulin-like domain-containing protein [Candidatus Doudnabacteria bacterium]|nr:Gmad2 immunoglobulin-like domain-containing protein [Candidatus Doudnabacteria bacterium]